MKKLIKNIFSAIMCIMLCFSVVAANVMSEANTIYVSAETMSNELQVYYYLVNTMGLNTAAACGVMANMSRESGFKTGAIGDSGTSYGLCQWHNSRWTDLVNYCNKNGLDSSTVEGQMSFFNYEVKNKYSTTYNAMYKATNDAAGAYEVAYTMCVNFEIPANRYVVAAQRGFYAQYGFWAKYANVTIVTANTDYTTSITNTTAVIAGSVSKPANVSISYCGIYLGTAEASLVKSGSVVYINDETNAKNNGKGFSVSCESGSVSGKPSLNLTLQRNTTYYYQFYFVASGVEYKGQVRSFKTLNTTESVAFVEKEVEAEYDYVAWYNKANVGKGSGSTVTKSLQVKITPSDSTDTKQWSSSDATVATVSDGVLTALSAGTTTVKLTAGAYSDTCTVTVGKINKPQLTLKSAAQKTQQSSFVVGDTLQISWDKQKSAGYHYLEIYRIDNGVQTRVFDKRLSDLASDGSFLVPNNYYEYSVSEPGKYYVQLTMANTTFIEKGTAEFEVLDKSDSLLDSSVAESSVGSNTGIGSLAGVSMSLDGYIVLNYYIIPTESSIGKGMTMQFTVAGRTSTVNEYEITNVGNKLAYKYVCRLTATELTESIEAKLVLGTSSKQIKTLTGYDYCSRLIANSGKNAAYAKAKATVMALMNYCGYAQQYFGVATDRLANAGLYGDDDPVLSSEATALPLEVNEYFSTYLNGTPVDDAAVYSQGAALNGIQYIGSSLQLLSGTSLNMYFMLPGGETAAELEGYVFSIEGFGTVELRTETVATVSESVTAAQETTDYEVEDELTDSIVETENETSDNAVKTEATGEVDNSVEPEATSEDVEATGEVVDNSVEPEAPGEDVEATDKAVDNAVETETIVEDEGVAVEAADNDVKPEATDDAQIEGVAVDDAVETENNASESASETVAEVEDNDMEADACTVAEQATEKATEEEKLDIIELTDTEAVTSQIQVIISTVVSGNNLSCSVQGNMLCITLENISADKLGDIYSIKVAPSGEDNSNGLLINYSPIKYMYDMQYSADSSGVCLARALYLYYKAIEEYKK